MTSASEAHLRQPDAAHRRRLLACSLVLTAPLVAEFASGNLPITYLWLLVIYAPLYGGAALLIRELGRRARRPWPVILTLGLAYGVMEEGFASFSLFNPHYADLELLDFGWIPALGIGAWWTVFVIVLHAVWSVCIPIVLVESFASELSTRPWLGRQGMLIAGSAVLFGTAATAGISLSEDDFRPSSGQLVAAFGAFVALLSIAKWLARDPRRPHNRPVPERVTDRPAPHPLTVALAAAVVAGAFYAGAAQAGPAVITIAAYAVLCFGALIMALRWSRRPGWAVRHRLSLAGGALVPHVGFALLQPTLVNVPSLLGVAGDLFFATALTTAFVLAWSRAPRPS